MEEEYKTSTGYKTFYGIIALSVFALMIWVPFDGKNGPNDPYPNYILPLIIGITVPLIVLINLLKRKVVISGYSIKYVSVWGTREIENNNVKGFRVLEKSIAIYSADDSTKIKIRDYMSIANLGELRNVLKEKYIDLDAAGYENNLNEIYINTELGNDKAERKNTFENSKLVAQIYNGGGIAIAILSLVFNEFVFDKQYTKVIPIIYALAGIIILITSKGIIKLIARRSSAYYSIIYGMYPVVIAALVEMITYYDFVSGSAFLIPVIIATTIIGALTMRFGYDRSENAAKGQIPAFIGLSLLFAVPVVMLINCGFDTSSAQVYNSTIVNRYVMHNNGRNYYHVVVDASGFSTDASKDMHITKKQYDKTAQMQNIHMAVKKGFLNVPWFYINK